MEQGRDQWPVVDMSNFMRARLELATEGLVWTRSLSQILGVKDYTIRYNMVFRCF